MAKETINVGTAPNDGLGDPIRTAYTKCNSNFNELYSRLQSATPGAAIGSIGDTAGMTAIGTNAADATAFGKFYYCFQDYDGSSEIWKVVTGSSF